MAAGPHIPALTGGGGVKAVGWDTALAELNSGQPAVAPPISSPTVGEFLSAYAAAADNSGFRFYEEQEPGLGTAGRRPRLVL